MNVVSGKEWEYIEAVLPHADRSLLYGPPGTGKTTIANKFGNPTEVYNIYVTEETPAAELRGHFVPKGGEWVWMHGPAIRAWLTGGRLVINEINSASGDTLDFLLAVCDDHSIAKIDLPNGDTVRPEKGFQVVATMNGLPIDLPEALNDRFTVTFNVTQPHPDAVAALSEDIQGAAKATASESGDRRVSVRSWMEFDKLRKKVPEETAAYAVFGTRARGVLDALKIAKAQVKATKTPARRK